MGDIVNLRRARKKRARDASEVDAAANRVAFGLGRAERAAANKLRGLEQDRLDGHERVHRDLAPDDQSE
ncbi:DUF4169 family protein [Methylocella tundrae]|uniref:DUF4169 family protein n=1 Tax=Methylocella tundrae TaxID=227605 RepID=UPI00106C93AD|nr:DUF4169 family protein [Methylocella tundrae]WPP05618.1 DUF4169 family protein [Methylocella tundrae]